MFFKLFALCDQRVIVQCIRRTGLFSRIVTDLLNPHIDTIKSKFYLIVRSGWHDWLGPEGQKTVQKAAHHFLEEGLQDALEMIFVKKEFKSPHTQFRTREILQFFGPNLNKVKKYTERDDD
ncbi:hypothetical protein BLNAU_17771 [Blattamonas nauphoetae]|uniref:Uncharacterized protein n=1 Tax=Blattamonas nauphoetae TaxID=2049346 RepID=A0ABQ9X6G4_9EUKA|nr:hypothetical protein BLNAU_17771 [Blattamonas nauphoetae]